MSFFDFNPALAADYYKVGHPWMQPTGMKTVYWTWTARNYKFHPGCPKTVVFGHQYTIKEWLHDFFQDNFFNRPLEELKREYEEVVGTTFGERYKSFEKFEALHKLGHLPIEIWGVPEGTLLPIGIPDHVGWNTDPRFAWLPQYLEDMWSANNWMPSTSATTAYYRRRLIEPYVKETCDNPDQLWHMCGDFSLRGHTSHPAAYISGAGHLLSFDRTATVHSNTLIRKFYMEDKPAGLGTPSLEHSVVEQGVAWFKNRLATGDLPEYVKPYVKQVCQDGKWEIQLVAEMCFILYLITEVQPEGVMTYVSDTYDYWGVVSKILPVIQTALRERKGCFSVRPDSGNPVKIICGDQTAPEGTPERRGTLGCLIDMCGNEVTINSKGFVVLPSYIRMIYGDAITPKITENVCTWCLDNRISVENLCFGIGAYTYQYVTRDTRGYAIKATDCIHEDFGEMPIFKQPKTDPGKKSPRGCVAVVFDSDDEELKMVDGLTLKESLEYEGNLMVCKYKNGVMPNPETFSVIRDRLMQYDAMDKREDK